jgi:hypothetical protein
MAREGKQMRGDDDRPMYEPPQLQVLGTLHELTLSDFCFFNKTLGSPDFWSKIPIANCSG